MRRCTSMGVVFLAALILSATAMAQSDLDEPFQALAAPKLGISGESFSLEPDGEALTLSWSGWLDLVKPSDDPVTVSIRFTLEPSGKWRSRPRNVVISDTFKPGVNSLFQKFDIANLDIADIMEGDSVPPARTFFSPDQVLTMKISLKSQSAVVASAVIDEHEYRFNLLGYLLLKAAKSGDANEVQALLDHGASPDAADVNGWSAVMASCAEGHLDVVRVLAERGANLVAPTKGFAFSESPNGSPIPGGATPLMVAAYAGRPDIVSLLLESGAAYGDYVNRLREQGASDEDIIGLIVLSGDARQDIIGRLVEKGADSGNIELLLRRDSLSDLVWRLTKRGVTFSATVDRLRQTGMGDDAIAGRLKREGAKDEDARRALQGKWLTDDELRKALSDKGATSEEMESLVGERDAPEHVVRACLKLRGASDSEIEGLMRERTQGDEVLRKFLKEKGMSEDDANRCFKEKGALPEALVAFLIKHGGRVDAQRADKWTPLMAAAFSGNPQVTQLLLDEGADPDMTEESSYSPAALAHINGNGSVYKLLRSRGAQVRVPWKTEGE